MTNPVSNQNADMAGTDLSTYLREREGLSACALEDGVIYHTYSAYARGVDGIWSMYPWLDRASKGRNETGPGCADATNMKGKQHNPRFRSQRFASTSRYDLANYLLVNGGKQ
jgi:predicted dithiol-disulfide oxidoreductase (DUF899 family)